MAVWTEDGKLYRKMGRETLIIEAWGRNALRVRAFKSAKCDENDWALTEDVSKHSKPRAQVGSEDASITNGGITAILNSEGWLSFINAKEEILLEEYWRNRNNLSRYCCPLNIEARELKPIPAQQAWKLSARFEARDGEKIYGMGQYQDSHLDKKGSILELQHRNTQASVPFYISSLGYGFLWNNPAVGRATFASNITEWEADATQKLDYWICAGDEPKDIMLSYLEATGFSPMMPDFAMGYWQCRLRYRTQEELLSVARRMKQENVPCSVIVADFFHWTIQGEFMFDENDWPDVPAMIDELNSLGIKLMVSIWPTVDSRSRNFREMAEKGLLVTNDRGPQIHMNWMGECVFFDATNPAAREFIWKRAKENYYDKGVRIFWLDEAEPEYGDYDFDNNRYYIGPAEQVTNVYPAMYAKAFYDGMTAEGQKDVLNLARCAWAGSQKYGALTWSGDVYSSFRSMRDQLTAGLSMAMAGIPWWNSDLGGFIGGAPSDENFRELLARWFQWGVFTPVMRMHGDRMPYEPPTPEYRNGVRQFGSGAPNEVWSFGEKMEKLLKGYINMREKLRPYIKETMKACQKKGTPPMRPLVYDYPQDENAVNETDAYMFGASLLVAPVLEEDATERSVYLPAGETWTEAYTGKEYEGGQTVTAKAPLEVIPVFVKKGCDVSLEYPRL
ncbi:MAG: glycoside hydrolase family 31 protein [Eubacteriales bacterium]|nr:glycoside hydrolase family 31 protein [Eubacteriales bacterium]MDD3881683.1 glycoside hydrolase family 31 protein [Eubacteriales bacterium]MDD4512258.1 glycoside hydrolase family 31 protein [Eubacteriales bacterium]